MERTETKQATILFFHCQVDPRNHIRLSNALDVALNSDTTVLPAKSYGRTYQKQVRELTYDNGFYFGSFAKLRLRDIPMVASAETEKREIELDQHEGLMEETFFLFDPRYQVLAFQQNHHCGTANQLGKYLTEVLAQLIEHNPIVFNPILLPAAWDRLLNESSLIRNLDLKISAPTNPEFYPDDEFSLPLFQLMNQQNGATLSLKLSANLRSGSDEASRLNRGIVGSIRNLLGNDQGNVERARFELDDFGIVDLLEDRLKTTKMVEMLGRYPAKYSVIRKLREAYSEQAEILRHIFESSQ